MRYVYFLVLCLFSTFVVSYDASAMTRDELISNLGFSYDKFEEIMPKKLYTKKGIPGLGRGNKKVSDEMLAEVLEKSSGLVTATVRLLAKAGIKINRNAIQDRINNSEKLQEIVRDGNEIRNDDAVLSLHKAIRNGEGWAVCFQLKCLGKDRGYIEKQQADANVNANISNAEPVRVVFEYPDNGRLASESTEQN